MLKRRLHSNLNSFIPRKFREEREKEHRISSETKKKMSICQQTQKFYYKRSNEKSRAFHINEKVMVKDYRNQNRNKWISGKKFKRLGQKFYLVEVNLNGKILVYHGRMMAETYA